MEDILNILEVLRSDLNVNDKINKFGIVKNRIGSICIISPINNNIEGISLVILNVKINSLGLVLKRALDFEIIINELTEEYISLYNYYDEETVVNFKIDNQILLYCTLDGYVEKDNLVNSHVSRFNFKLIESS